MAVETKTQLKAHFETGDIPTEEQFGNLIDTMIDRAEFDGVGFPYKQLFSEDFSSDIGGWVGFNNGSATYEAGNQRVLCGAGGTGIAHSPSNLVGGKKYRCSLDITLGTATEVRVIPKWSAVIETLTTNGEHYFEWTQAAGAQSFGGDLILSRDSGTFYLNSFKLWEVNEDATVHSKSEINNLIDALDISPDLTVLYSQNFEDGEQGEVTSFGTVTRTVGSGKMTVVLGSGSNHIAGFGRRLDREPMKVGIYLDIDSLNAPIQVKSNFNETQNFVITTAGIYHIVLAKKNSYPTAAIERVLIFADDNTGNRTFVINEMAIFDIADDQTGLDPSTDNVVIGNGATSEAPNQNQVAIGKNAVVDQTDSVAVGKGAKAKFSQWYTAVDSNEATAIGHDSYAHGWRTTAVGAKAHAGGQSSTALGCGTVARSTHGCGIGRGVIVPSNAQGGQNVTVIMNSELYFENNWGHKMSRPESGISVGSSDTPNTHEVKLHGFDAFDARFPAWNSAASYSVGDWVQVLDGGSASDGVTGDVYQALTANTNSTPVSNPTDWALRWQTAGGTPDSFNVDGGHIALEAGRGTGTGLGGEVRFKAARSNNTGQNTKNPNVVVGKFTSNETTGTHFYLVNAATGTMHQVKIGADNSGGVGLRALTIDNA